MPSVTVLYIWLQVIHLQIGLLILFTIIYSHLPSFH